MLAAVASCIIRFSQPYFLARSPADRVKNTGATNVKLAKPLNGMKHIAASKILARQAHRLGQADAESCAKIHVPQGAKRQPSELQAQSSHPYHSTLATKGLSQTFAIAGLPSQPTIVVDAL